MYTVQRHLELAKKIKRKSQERKLKPTQGHTKPNNEGAYYYLCQYAGICTDKPLMNEIQEQDNLIASKDSIDLAVLNREACDNLNDQFFLEKLKLGAGKPASTL